MLRMGGWSEYSCPQGTHECRERPGLQAPCLENLYEGNEVSMPAFDSMSLAWGVVAMQAIQLMPGKQPCCGAMPFGRQYWVDQACFDQLADAVPWKPQIRCCVLQGEAIGDQGGNGLDLRSRKRPRATAAGLGRDVGLDPAGQVQLSDPSRGCACRFGDSVGGPPTADGSGVEATITPTQQPPPVRSQVVLKRLAQEGELAPLEIPVQPSIQAPKGSNQAERRFSTLLQIGQVAMKARRPGGEQTGELPIHRDGPIKAVKPRYLAGSTFPLGIEERRHTMKELDPSDHTQRKTALLNLSRQGALKGDLDPELVLGDTHIGDADQRSAARTAVECGPFNPLMLVADGAGVL